MRERKEEGGVVEAGKGVGYGIVNARNVENTKLGVRGQKEVNGRDEDRVVKRLSMQGVEEVDGVRVVCKDGNAARGKRKGGQGPVKGRENGEGLPVKNAIERRVWDQALEAERQSGAPETETNEGGVREKDGVSGRGIPD
jgi:hypothetical protein